VVLECRFDDDRDIAGEIAVYQFKEKIGNDAIGIWWKLVMLDAECRYVPFFDLVAAYDRHPQTLTEFLCKSGFTRSLPSSDDDAFWFFVHLSKFLALIIFEVFLLTIEKNADAIFVGRFVHRFCMAS
jgi:hypothetical protein